MDRPLRPQVLGDVLPRRSERSADIAIWDVFAAPQVRLNLSYRRAFRPRIMKSMKALLVTASVLFLIFGSVSAPTVVSHAIGDTASSTDPNTERAQLQNQLQQLETQIDQYEGQIASYETQGKTLSGEIGTLNAKIAKLNLQIQATTLTISQLNQQIGDTQAQIQVTQADIQSKTNAIASLMQNLYKNDQVSLIEIFLENPHLSDFWNDTQNIALVQDNLRVAVQQVTDLQNQLQDQEQQFVASKADATTAAAYQKAQAAEVASTKTQKSQLLAETKGQESKYQVLLTQTRATAAQIRNRIFQLLGGGQLTFEDAYQYAKLASTATGIDPAFILAILDRESALGQNVGQCGYKTAMRPSEIPTFLSITQSLNLDPNTMMVSCPNADGAYGGAMGPAQFLPSTWMLYAAKIQNITSNNPPSPWNNADAFVATALYLNDAMAGCKAIYSATVSQERCTAAKYYAGSRWKNYLWTYGEAVVERAQSFDGDIATITS